MDDPTFALNVSVVICEGERFLLIKRSGNEDIFPGYWGIPGGAVEVTDLSLEDALQRECEEEVGVSVEDITLVSNNIVVRNNKKVVYIVYKAKILSGTPTPKDGTELAAWKDINEARTLKLTPKTLEILELVSSAG